MKYVKIIECKKSFPNHPKAKEYGMKQYHYWLGFPICKNGDIFEVIKEVLVNDSTPSFILRDSNGIEYLIGKTGCVPHPKRPYPKVMLVWDSPEEIPRKRVVFMEKCGKFLSWSQVDNLKDAEKITLTSVWNYAEDIHEVPNYVEMTFEEIAEKLNIDSNLLRIKKS